MKIGSTRTLEENREVLKDPDSVGPDPVYWVFSGIETVPWDNMTVFAPGRYTSTSLSTNGGGEYPKTFGHYHPEDSKDEVYTVIHGDGIFVMQKKFFDENGQWVENKVSEVVLIFAKHGDEVVIKPEWGHSWSNVGDDPLITSDNWIWGHTPADYEVIGKMHGMAYYLIEEAGAPKAVPNPNYADLPEPQWLNVEQFSQKYG